MGSPSFFSFFFPLFISPPHMYPHFFFFSLLSSLIPYHTTSSVQNVPQPVLSFFFFFPLSTSSVTPMQELIQLQNVPLSAWIGKIGWLEPTTIVLRSNQTPLYCARIVEQPQTNFRPRSPSSFSIFFLCSWSVVVSDFRFVRSASIFFSWSFIVVLFFFPVLDLLLLLLFWF